MSLGIVVKYQMIVIMGTHAYVFYFVLLICMLVLGPSHIIFINLALYYGLKYVMIILPNLLFCSVFLWLSLVFHELIFISEYFYVSVKKNSSVFLLELYWTCKFCLVRRSFLQYLFHLSIRIFFIFLNLFLQRLQVFIAYVFHFHD